MPTKEPQAITVSLEWARNLKQAGWSQGTSFFISSQWNDGLATEPYPRTVHPNYMVEMNGRERPDLILDRPSAEEIMELLPPFLAIYRTENIWNVRLSLHDPTARHEFEESLSNAVAAMFCHLAARNLLP